MLVFLFDLPSMYFCISNRHQHCTGLRMTGRTEPVEQPSACATEEYSVQRLWKNRLLALQSTR